MLQNQTTNCHIKQHCNRQYLKILLSCILISLTLALGPFIPVLGWVTHLTLVRRVLGAFLIAHSVDETSLVQL